jgi:hypothetical protein
MDRPTSSAEVRKAMIAASEEATIDAHNTIVALTRFYGRLLEQQHTEITRLIAHCIALKGLYDALNDRQDPAGPSGSERSREAAVEAEPQQGSGEGPARSG